MIWQRDPLGPGFAAPDIAIAAETAGDELGISALLGCTIPRILQSVMAPSAEMTGLLFRKEGQVEAYLAYSEGRHGVYLMPYVHPEVLSEAADIIAAALMKIDRCRKLPVYICVRGYQGWLENAMRDLGFSPWLEQAVMVKHLTAGVRQASFDRLQLSARGRSKAGGHVAVGWTRLHRKRESREIQRPAPKVRNSRDYYICDLGGQHPNLWTNA